MKTTKFHFDASFRVSGLGHLHNEISDRTGLLPDICYLKGENKYPNSKTSKVKSKIDIWTIKSPLDDDNDLGKHLDWIWDTIKPHKRYFKQLIKKADWADILLGCRTKHMYPVLFVDKIHLNILKDLDLSIGFNFTLL
jgi:hypothetical protein